jgi:hypothetical protein
MKKYLIIRSYLLLGLLSFMAGCEKDATNVDLPETNPKLVLGCFISPQDTLITVEVGRSNPIFGNNHNTSGHLYVLDASVTLSDGSTSIVLPLVNTGVQQGTYIINASLFPISPGTTYYLTVTTPQGENVSASCTVPISNVTTMSLDYTDTVPSDSYNDPINVTAKWQDIPGQVNYYRVYGSMLMEGEHISNGWTVKDTSNSEMYGNNFKSLINASDKDGSQLSFRLDGYYFGDGFNTRIVGYGIYILNVDLNYYNYQKSLENYSYGDPFSEPSPIYTNVNGGLGVFAGYQVLYQKF